MWLYGAEGNSLYLAIVKPLRVVTQRMPLWMIRLFCYPLTLFADIYAVACRVLPLPMKRYFTEVYGQFNASKRYLAIFDQLHPAYAKYYSQSEARDLMQRSGFSNVQIHHRGGYSWTVIGEKVN